MEHFLLQLVDVLPDMELLVNVNDYPLSPRYSPPLPFFSFSKVTEREREREGGRGEERRGEREREMHTHSFSLSDCSTL